MSAFKACKSPVGGSHGVSLRGSPPDSFLFELVDWGKDAPEVIFAANDRADIYGSVRAVLGPWQGILHRRAVMLEVLRALGGMESSWNWDEGVDTTNHTSMTHLMGQETGIFQVSADSMAFDPSLKACVRSYVESVEPQHFIDGMKAIHRFALEYCARLLRFSVAWDGPLKRGELHPFLSRDAVTELMTLLV